MGRAVSNDRSAKCSATTFPIDLIPPLSGSGNVFCTVSPATVATESATAIFVVSFAGVSFPAWPPPQPAVIAAMAMNIITFFILYNCLCAIS